MPGRRVPATLSLQAYDRVRNKILVGEYALGEPLSRRRVAEELGMSLIPVSEALQRLESEGLVESKPRAGTRVKIPTVEDIRGHYIVREALETQSARLFVTLATREQKAELRNTAALVDRLSLAVARVDEAHKAAAGFEFERAHLHLHTRIAECGNCAALVDAIERSRVLIYNWLFNVTADLEALPAAWHRDLVKALTSGDPLEADAAMRRHVTFRQGLVIERFTALQQAGHFAKFQRGPRRRSSAADRIKTH
ncbi:MAG: GntR family transcriptional regulator [Bryobacterales bacterium]|nr:GntR family transcriptional regulator [Bryobacterales bacterium]